MNKVIDEIKQKVADTLTFHYGTFDDRLLEIIDDAYITGKEEGDHAYLIEESTTIMQENYNSYIPDIAMLIDTAYNIGVEEIIMEKFNDPYQV